MKTIPLIFRCRATSRAIVCQGVKVSYRMLCYAAIAVLGGLLLAYNEVVDASDRDPAVEHRRCAVHR
jgi:hypothetical protein